MQKTLELGEAIFSPEMIWEAVPQCRCSKSERFFTVPCRFDLWYFQNVAVFFGIDIDYQLNFDAHISTICMKTSQQINILKRLGSYLNRLNKITIFHTFILSNFNFCPLAWHSCTNKNSKKLEKVQERALRFVYEDYNSSVLK
jgi:hypothetical protein